MTARARTYEILEGSWEGDRLAATVNIAMVALIVANVVVVMLESIASLREQYRAAFFWFEAFSVLVFGTEYALRLWACPEERTGRYRSPVLGRLRYAATPLAIIDLLAILPFVLLAAGGWDLRFLRVFRLFRLLKLSRYFPAMQMVGRVFHGQRRALMSALFVMLVMLTFSSSVIYLVEHEAQPGKFASIPESMWWGMATLTTVGYGDVTPITPLGKVLGGVIAIIGIGMFALPAAILASGFTEELERRDFVVSWNIVASLPVFENLRAREIAEIAKLLRPHVAVPGEVLFRRGDMADALYFVRSGRVDMEFPDRTVPIDDGDFFGEIGLIHGRRRMATARAQSSCRLLVVDQADFEKLCAKNRAIREHFEQVAASRLSESPRPGPSDPAR